MKKAFRIFIVLAFLLALLPAVTLAHTEGDPFEVDLFAGQNEDIGDVLVWNDAANLYVQYVITEPAWCITETHLDVQLYMLEIPQTKKGNPTPGHFAYAGEHDCVSSVNYEIPLNWPPETELYIAAHAAVEKPPSIIVYGSRRSPTSSMTGDIYAIDLATKTATIAGDFEGPVSPWNYPNGNAYDPDNLRVYLADPNEVLHFLDLGEGMFYSAGSLNSVGSVASGAWHDGKYYYIPQGTDDLHEVVVTADGGGGFTNTDTKLCDFTDGNKSFSFGDIVFNSTGLLLGSGNSGTSEYFTIDITSGCTYEFKEYASHKQLAFSGGTLYGHNAGTGEFYIIDPDTWSETPIGTVSIIGETGNGLFTDLASGPSSYQTETAWGDGEGFPGRNWAMYFTYTVQYTCPAITSHTGDINILTTPLDDVRYAQNTAEIPQVFAEYAGTEHGGFKLDINAASETDVSGGGYAVDSGTPVCSYYVHFDDGNVDHDWSEGSLTFEENVMGLIVAGTTRTDDIFNQAGINTMCDTDAALGNASTTYPNPSTCGMDGVDPDARGLEISNTDPSNSGNQDPIWIDGNTVHFDLNIYNKHDSLRIILAIP